MSYIHSVILGIDGKKVIRASRVRTSVTCLYNNKKKKHLETNFANFFHFAVTVTLFPRRSLESLWGQYVVSPV